MKIFGIEIGSISPPPPVVPVQAVDDLDPYTYSGQTSPAPWNNSIHDGSKFFGGYGDTQILDVDYWTLRQRSSELFTTNLYARGLIRRLITNEINTGLTPEAAPDENVLGVPEDSLNDWTEDVETRFGIWAKSPMICDWKQVSTFGAIQRTARTEALVSGDVLVVLRQSPKTKLPMVQLISGSKVRTPLSMGGTRLAKGHKIKHGVELDGDGRVVAHWVRQKDGTSKRLPAWGARSGRKISWLVYGTDKRLDELRGQPLLAIVLQSLKEVDRYRDSAQRKAVINSIMAMFIKKTQDKMGSLPIQGGAVRRDTAEVTDGDGTTRNFNIAQQIPGLVIEELQHGEEPVFNGGQGTDVNFGPFESAVISGVAWANEIPPEILTLAFSNNYSASQAAINEFKIYLNMRWSIEGETFCSPIYNDWLLSEVLLQKIPAPGLIQAWRDPSQYDILGAWLSTDWYGSIKPSTDMLKQAKGSKMLTDEGWSTNAREARATTGTKFSKNIKRLKLENAQKAEAARPLLELEKEFGVDTAAAAISALDDATQVLTEGIEDVT